LKIPDYNAYQSDVISPVSTEEVRSAPDSAVVKGSLEQCVCECQKKTLGSEVTIKQLSSITHCSICEGLINFENADLKNDIIGQKNAYPSMPIHS